MFINPVNYNLWICRLKSGMHLMSNSEHIWELGCEHIELMANLFQMKRSRSGQEHFGPWFIDDSSTEHEFHTQI